MHPSEIEVHPICAAFPMMTGDEFDELLADMQKHGQREPVTYWRGQLIDGRNRLKACEVLNIEPDTCELDACEDGVSWIVSQNLHRRHLTPSQKAMVAQSIREHYDAEAANRKAEGQRRGAATTKGLVEILPPSDDRAKARDKAGEAVGVSGKLVDAAKKVVEAGIPELSEAVTAGKVAVSRAAKIADLPPAEQLEAIENPPERTKRPAKELVAEFITKALEAGNHQASQVAKALFDQLDNRQRELVCGLWVEWFEANQEVDQ